MDKLATDVELAERFSVAGRDGAVAEAYRWQDLIERWINVYRRVGNKAKRAPVAALTASGGRTDANDPPRGDGAGRSTALIGYPPEARNVGQKRGHH